MCIRQVPWFHWMVTAFLASFTAICVINDAPWWALTITAVIFAGQLIINSRFRLQTNILLDEQVILYSSCGVTGCNRRSIEFSEVKEVEVITMTWGSNRNHKRYTLHLNLPEHDYCSLVVSTADQAVFDLASKLAGLCGAELKQVRA